MRWEAVNGLTALKANRLVEPLFVKLTVIVQRDALFDFLSKWFYGTSFAEFPEKIHAELVDLFFKLEIIRFGTVAVHIMIVQIWLSLLKRFFLFSIFYFTKGYFENCML